MAFLSKTYYITTFTILLLELQQRLNYKISKIIISCSPNSFLT